MFYLDDIIVFSSTSEEHLARLRQVFERLRHADLKLGAEKCTFAAKEVSYLGHRVRKEGLLPDSALLAAIREIPPPKTATEVCSFLGLAGYYRRYVKNFAAIAGPLHALTRKDAVFYWSADCQTAFDRLKTLFGYTPTSRPQASAQSWRKSATARSASSAVLCDPSTMLRKPIPPPSWNAKFRPYLMAMPFKVFTDHYDLQWLKTMGTGSALLHRWSAALEEYDFTVKHRPGKAQAHVDGLSQLPVNPAPPEDVLLHICLLENEQEARELAQELHSATHLGGQALWKLFRDQYDFKSSRRICLEVAQSCPQCQMGSDYGHRQKTTEAMQSRGP